MIEYLAMFQDALHASPSWLLTCLAISMFLTCIGIYALLRCTRYWSWHATEGEVIESRLFERKYKDKYGCYIYDPVVRYSYDVGGRRFENDTISLHFTARPPEKGAMLNVSYPVGKKVTVFYHPRRPTRSMLFKAPWRLRLAASTAGLVMTITFGVILGQYAATTPRMVAEQASSIIQPSLGR